MTLLNAVAGLLRGLGVDPASREFEIWMRAGFGVGALLAVLAALTRTWAAAYLSSEVIHDSALHTDKLVADGPYRHVRNPLYLGLILLASGLALFASRIGLLIIVGGMFVIMLRLIGREEAELAQSQGAAFQAFCRAGAAPAAGVASAPAGVRPAAALGPGLSRRDLPLDPRRGEHHLRGDRGRRTLHQICAGGMLIYLALMPLWKRRRR